MHRVQRLRRERAGALRIASVNWVWLLFLSGCVSVPDADQLIASAEQGTVRIEDAGCTRRRSVSAADPRPDTGIDPSGFGVLVWNLHKGEEEGWQDDLARLSTGKDLVLLQEAHLTPSFHAALEQSRYHWSMARAFDLEGAETGVLTAAKIPASSACLKRTPEPVIRVPKSVLVTRYPLNGLGEDLWVANVHGVNFTLGTTHFRAQLEALANLAAAHRGPLILAGDFNNWSQRRSKILFEITGKMGLVPLTLADDVRSHHWGNPVDFVFYRGVEVEEAGAIQVFSSDHNPIRVKFKLPGYPRKGKQR